MGLGRNGSWAIVLATGILVCGCGDTCGDAEQVRNSIEETAVRDGLEPNGICVASAAEIEALLMNANWSPANAKARAGEYDTNCAKYRALQVDCEG